MSTGTVRSGVKRALSFIALTLCTAAAQQALAAPLIIDSFRVRGPNGANDEYISIYNTTATAHTVASISGTGYGVAASDGVTRCTIPNGTVIPFRGHYLCVNSVGYSLASYPAGNGTTATGDATYTTDIPDNAGIAIFNNNTGGGSYILANRMDAVGSTSEPNVLYKEGTGYPALTPFSIDYAFTRDICGKAGSITTMGACPNGAFTPIDNDNNAADFYFVDTNGTSAGAGQRLGAPSPRNLSSPLMGTAPNTIDFLDTCTNNVAPNVVRDFTSDPANNSTFGTLDVRRTFTNNTGGNITRLRYRIIDLTTFPAPSGIADLRPRTSSAVVVTVDRPPCGSGTSNVTVQGTTLEQPPSQPNGGGFESSMSSGTVTLATPLANGASLDFRLLFGIQQTGAARFAVAVEALPIGGGTFYFECDTDFCGPRVLTITRLDPNPTSAGSVQYTVTFSKAVTGVDAADFALTTTGGITGAAVSAVTGTGATRTVTVNTGTGNGTIRLDVVDNDTILDAAGNPLIASTGSPPPANGSFTTGEVYTVNKVPPTVSSITRTNPSPTAAASVQFNVTFSESVTGVDTADFTLTTTGVTGASITGVTGSGAAYVVTVNTGVGNGTIRLDVADNDSIINSGNTPLGGTGAGNGNFTTGEVYTVTKIPPTVSSIVRASGSPTAAASVQFNVTFSEAVTGVDTGDFTLTTTGVAGASITGVTGSGAAYVVTVNTGTGNGTIRLDVADNDSIINGVSTPLGGVGAGNGNFTAGEVYTIDKTQPAVSSITRAGTNPTNAASVQFNVTFSQAVTGVDTADFTLTATVSASGVVSAVSGSGTSYVVTVSSVSGNGTLRLDVTDNDSIVNGLSVPLGGTGAGNGNFTTGEAYTIDTTAPTVTVNQAGSQADPSPASPINFTVTFSEAVTGFTSAGVVLGGSAGATSAVVTGGPTAYNVAVGGMSANGSVTVSIAGAAATDAAGNTSAASTSTDNAVAYIGIAVINPSIPVPGPGAGLLALLGLMLAGVARFAVRRRTR